MFIRFCWLKWWPIQFDISLNDFDCLYIIPTIQYLNVFGRFIVFGFCFLNLNVRLLIAIDKDYCERTFYHYENPE